MKIFQMYTFFKLLWTIYNFFSKGSYCLTAFKTLKKHPVTCLSVGKWPFTACSHAVMWKYLWRRPYIHKLLAGLYCKLILFQLTFTGMPMVYLGWKAEGILSCRNFLHTARLTEFRSCSNAKGEQALQCTPPLLALGEHRLCIQLYTGVMQSSAESSQFPGSLSWAQLKSPECKWVSKPNVLLTSKMRSMQITSAL